MWVFTCYWWQLIESTENTHSWYLQKKKKRTNWIMKLWAFDGVEISCGCFSLPRYRWTVTQEMKDSGVSRLLFISNGVSLICMVKGSCNFLLLAYWSARISFNLAALQKTYSCVHAQKKVFCRSCDCSHCICQALPRKRRKPSHPLAAFFCSQAACGRSF
jgi:hypothetical protein